MIESMASAALLWLGTYALHSTSILGGIWIFECCRHDASPALRELLWRTGLLAAVVTASLQVSGVVRPILGSFEVSFAPAASGETAFVDRAPALSAPPVRLGAPPSRSVAPSASAAVAPSGLPPTAAGSSPELTVSPPSSSLASAPPPTSTKASSAFDLDLGFGLDVLLALWLAGVWLLAARMIFVARAAHRELAGRLPIVHGPLFERIQHLAARAGLERLPRVSVSARIRGPFTLPNGEICIPDWASAKLSTPQLDAMLAHEIAHVVRRDALWLVVGLVMQTLFFFQPLNVLARRRLAMLGELSADEWAAAHTDGGRALAECLAEFAGVASRGRAPAFAAAMAHDESSLVRRVRRLLEGRRPRALPVSAKLVIAVGAVFLSGMIPGLMAQTRDPVREPLAVSPEQRSVTPESPEPVAAAPERVVVAPEPVAAETQTLGSPPKPVAKGPGPVAETADAPDVFENVNIVIAQNRDVPDVPDVPDPPDAPDPPDVPRPAPAGGANRFVVPVAPVAPVEPVEAVEPVLPAIASGAAHAVSFSMREDCNGFLVVFHRCVEEFSVEADGDIELAPDGSGVLSIANGGYVDVSIERDGVERRVRLEGRNGAIDREYRVDRRARDWDDDADAFLREVVLLLLRTTGISAPERVAWLLDHGGPDALLDEIELVRSDSVQRLYSQLYGRRGKMPDRYFERLTQLARDGIGSDSNLRATLLSLYETQRPTGDQLLMLVRAADTIGSDSNARAVLEALGGRLPPTDEAVSAFLLVADTIGSDSNMRAALRPMLQREDLSDEQITRLIQRASRSIGSDSNLGDLLSGFAPRVGRSDQLARAYTNATSSIGSDSWARATLLRLASAADLSPEGWRMLLKAAESIGSDSNCAALLVEVARRMPRDEETIAAYRRVLATVGSEALRLQATEALDRNAV